jgi:hypothetical protein
MLLMQLITVIPSSVLKIKQVIKINFSLAGGANPPPATKIKYLSI